jgi:hypothetical protein
MLLTVTLDRNADPRSDGQDTENANARLFSSAALKKTEPPVDFPCTG